MTDQKCGCCHSIGPQRADLVHDGTGTHITICFRCLRTAMRMKAAAEDQRGRMMLTDVAERCAWQVWRGGPVLYLLPSIAPFDPASHSVPPSSPALGSVAGGPLQANGSDASLQRRKQPGVRFSSP